MFDLTMKNKIILFSVLWLCQLSACSSHNTNKIPPRVRYLKHLTIIPTNHKPEHKIILKKNTTYGDSSGFYLIPKFKGIAVDYKKRVYILNFPEKLIYVYNPDGSYLRKIGKNGRGPGEFQWPLAIRIKHNNLYILGYNQQKICVYNLKTLHHVRDDYLSLNRITGKKPSWLIWASNHNWYYRAVNFYVRSDDSYLVFFSDSDIGIGENISGRTYVVSIFKPDEGKYSRQNILSFPWTEGLLANNKMVIPYVPYKRRSEFTYFDGQLVYGWTGDFLFKFYNDDGNYEKAFCYPYKKAKLKIKDILAYYHNPSKQIIKSIRDDSLPNTWPVFNKVVMSDKRQLWVSTNVKNRKVHKWWILNQNGKLLGTFTWPINRIIEVVKDGYAYALVHDFHDGIDKIVRYQIKFRKVRLSETK
ncbi:MAG TPA: 6-bladed beta-propeller [Balneolales bacterium]|nr:6-bladed beta-propeller [Balneolales bacterium]